MQKLLIIQTFIKQNYYELFDYNKENIILRSVYYTILCYKLYINKCWLFISLLEDKRAYHYERYTSVTISGLLTYKWIQKHI